MPTTPRAIAALGTLSYTSKHNGTDLTFTFPGAVTTSFTVNPVYSLDGRTVKYSHATLLVETILVATDFDAQMGLGEIDPTVTGWSIDQYMDTLRNVLSRPGGRLIYTGHGMGDDLDISGAFDVDFGPKPKLIALRCVGANQAIHVIWQVETTFINCIPHTALQKTIPLDFSYSVSFDVDHEGMTVRTVTAAIEAYMHRGTGNQFNTFTNTADIFAQRINPRIPDGFKRSTRRSLSPDKKMLTLQITDTEIASDYAYPAKMVECDVTQSSTLVADKYISGNTYWAVNFTGNFKVAPGVGKGFAWREFLNIVNSRKPLFAGSTPGDDSAEGYCFIIAFNAVDKIYSRICSFSLTYIVLTSLEKMFKNTGMFRKIPGGDQWQKWRLSMPNNIVGSAGLIHQQNDDLVVSICDDDKLPSTDRPVVLLSPSEESIEYPNPCPPKDKSYVSYVVHPHVTKISNDVVHTRLGYPEGDKYLQSSSGLDFSLGSTGSGTTVPSNSRELQERGTARYKVILHGYASRICYPPVAPHLESVGGKPAKLHADMVSTRPIGRKVGGKMLYSIQFTRVYYVDPSDRAALRIGGVPDSQKNKVPTEIPSNT